MNNQGLIYTRFPFSSIENMVLPGNLTDQETQLIYLLRVDVEKFNAIEWEKDNKQIATRGKKSSF